VAAVVSGLSRLFSTRLSGRRDAGRVTLPSETATDVKLRQRATRPPPVSDNALITIVSDDGRLWTGFPGVRTLQVTV
jgi:hypothetical protein